MEKNIRKRLIIGLIYLIFFLVIFWFVYSIFRIKPTCVDGIKNQNEVDIDCGGSCPMKCAKNDMQDLVIGETGVVESSTVGEYDFYGMARNPNNFFGSKYFEYIIKFKDENGLILMEKKGNNFILPGEQKYIIETNIKLSSFPSNIDFSIVNSQWVEADDFYEKPDLKIVNSNYNEINSGIGFSEAKGLLQNKSQFDFALIGIKIILRDADGKVVALNSTEMRTVMSGENRDYRVFWPNRFSGEVVNVESQIEANVFDSEAFAKEYFKLEKIK